MKTSTRSWLYALMFPSVYAAARLFFKRFKVIGSENFPKGKKPAIVVSNHQNALMDPLICCLTAPKQMHFLTRADVFKTPLSRKCVLELNMMPVYRTHDKVDDMSGLNKVTFDVAIERLHNGAAVGIYPEGNHGNKKILRPFKKGLARLLESAGQQYTDLKSLEIVAVGIDYSNYNNARTDTTIVFSKPFRVDDILFSDLEAPVRYRLVMERIRQKLSEVMIDHALDQYYTLRLAEALVTGKTTWEQKKLVLDAIRDSEKITERQEQEMKAIDHLLGENELEQIDWVRFSRDDKPNLLVTMVAILIALPSLIVNSLPWQIILGLTKKVVKDPHFNSTFKLVFSWILFPLWAFIAGFFLHKITGHHYLITVAAVALSGVISLPFLDIIALRKRHQRAKKLAHTSAENYAIWKGHAEQMENIIKAI
jgi:1-acyl-sn-glycerol-3-phosphate acyltransferase